MARPARILLTLEQLKAISQHREGQNNKAISRELHVSAEAVRKWFEIGAFVRRCADHYEKTSGKALYPPDTELMRRYRCIR